MTKITLAIVTALLLVSCSPTKADAKSNEGSNIATPTQEVVVEVTLEPQATSRVSIVVSTTIRGRNLGANV